MKKRLNDFLNELSELTKKYSLKINGCGCCGSPRIDTIGGDICLVSNLCYYEDEEVYKCDWDDKSIELFEQLKGGAE